MSLRDSFMTKDKNGVSIEVIRIRTVEYQDKQFVILGIAEDDYIGCQVCRSFGYKCIGNGLIIKEINGESFLPVEDEVEKGILDQYQINAPSIHGD